MWPWAKECRQSFVPLEPKGRKTVLTALRNGAFPVTSINKEVTAISDSSPQIWLAELRRGPGRTVPVILQPSVISHGDPWGAGVMGWGGRGKAPESWDEYERNGFSKPRLLHLPIHGKVLNSLRYLVLLNNQQSFNVQTTCPLLQLLYNLTPPPASSEQFSQGYFRCSLSPAWSPENVYQIKHNTQLLDCY